jgi:hypothetical protein
VPLRAAEIAAALEDIAPGWPKRVGDSLFLEGADYRPVFLESATRVFAWADRIATVDWAKGIGKFIPQERFFEHLRMTRVPSYDVIETLPHWPRLSGAYYMHAPVGRGDGRLLDRLLDFFRPHSDVDRELIRAMIFSLFWGGAPGTRPAFLITGPDQDAEQGRGLGKSTLPAIVAEELAGGYIDISPTGQIADVKTRLLSDGAHQTRVARLDNVKTLKFSWADLEGLITATVISGRALYKGEGRRPNTLVWIITLNGASLSKDMAQRVIVIKLDRPAFRPTWEEETRAFIRENRVGILADIRQALEDDPGIVTPRTRWAAWEQGVLAKTDDLMRCQDTIVERQGTIDDDNEERDLIEQHFVEELRKSGHNPETGCVTIPYDGH